MFKLCPIIHWWTKIPKQWIDNDRVFISKRCRHCGTLKEEGKRIEKVKKLILLVKKFKGGS